MVKPGSNPGCLGPLLELLTTTLGSLALGLGGMFLAPGDFSVSWPHSSLSSRCQACGVACPTTSAQPAGTPPAQGLSCTPLPRQRHSPSFLCVFLPAWMPALLPHLALNSSTASQAPHVGGAYQLGTLCGGAYQVGTPCVRCFVCEASFFGFLFGS